MFITVSKSSIGETYYLSKGLRDKKTKKNTSVVVERIGTKKDLEQRLGPNVDIKQWLKDYAKKRTAEEKRNIIKIPIHFQPNQKVSKSKLRLNNGGYLFLKSILHDIKLDKICKTITDKENLDFDLFQILETMIYNKIFFPKTNTSTKEFSYWLLEKSSFNNNDVYKAISVLSKYCDKIQVALHNSERQLKDEENSSIFYNCSNYYFENYDEDDGSKSESTITELRMYFNGDSTPLAFSYGKKNIDINTLDEYIVDKYKDSNIYVCPDSINTNASKQILNSFKNVEKINIFALPHLNKSQQQWAKDPNGWQTYGSSKKYNINELEKQLRFVNLSQLEYNKLMNQLFYKKKQVTHKDPVTGESKKEFLYVFFNFELKMWQKNIRKDIIERVNRDIELDNINTDYHSSNIITQIHKYQSLLLSSVLKDDQNKNEGVQQLNRESLQEDEQFDGYYALFTDLDQNSIYTLINFMISRSQIETIFDNIKSEYKSRRDIKQEDSIKVHFLTSFLSMLVFKLLEQKLDFKYWNTEISYLLQNMNFYHINEVGYLPTYTPSQLTDELHDKFGFETDFEFISTEKMEKILEKVKKQD